MLQIISALIFFCALIIHCAMLWRVDPGIGRFGSCAIIHLKNLSRILHLKALLKLTSTGWTSPVKPPCAASRDELNLQAEGLDGIDNHPHLVDPKLVQEEDGNDPRQCHCNVGGAWAKPFELALPGYIFSPTWPGLRNS
jgi:hypothetical protein